MLLRQREMMLSRRRKAIPVTTKRGRAVANVPTWREYSVLVAKEKGSVDVAWKIEKFVVDVKQIQMDVLLLANRNPRQGSAKMETIVVAEKMECVETEKLGAGLPIRTQSSDLAERKMQIYVLCPPA